MTNYTYIKDNPTIYDNPTTIYEHPTLPLKTIQQYMTKYSTLRLPIIYNNLTFRLPNLL